MTVIQVDPGGEIFIPFAKKKLKQWHEEMLRSGVQILDRVIQVSDGSAIYIESVLLAAGFFRDRIRITGGDVEGTNINDISGSASFGQGGKLATYAGLGGTRHISFDKATVAASAALHRKGREPQSVASYVADGVTENGRTVVMHVPTITSNNDVIKVMSLSAAQLEDEENNPPPEWTGPTSFEQVGSSGWPAPIVAFYTALSSPHTVGTTPAVLDSRWLSAPAQIGFTAYHEADSDELRIVARLPYASAVVHHELAFGGYVHWKICYMSLRWSAVALAWEEVSRYLPEQAVFPAVPFSSDFPYDAGFSIYLGFGGGSPDDPPVSPFATGTAPGRLSTVFYPPAPVRLTGLYAVLSNLLLEPGASVPPYAAPNVLVAAGGGVVVTLPDSSSVSTGLVDEFHSAAETGETDTVYRHTIKEEGRDGFVMWRSKHKFFVFNEGGQILQPDVWWWVRGVGIVHVALPSWSTHSASLSPGGRHLIVSSDVFQLWFNGAKVFESEQQPEATEALYNQFAGERQLQYMAAGAEPVWSYSDDGAFVATGRTRIVKSPAEQPGGAPTYAWAAPERLVVKWDVDAGALVAIRSMPGERTVKRSSPFGAPPTAALSALLETNPTAVYDSSNWVLDEFLPHKT